MGECENRSSKTSFHSFHVADAGLDSNSVQRIWRWVKIFAFLILAVSAFRTLAFQTYITFTSSMAPTIHPGDAILVSKFHYGLEVPRVRPMSSKQRPDLFKSYIHFPGISQIKRGDVIAFHVPNVERPITQKPVYIKRVIGIPGDTVALHNSVVYVNGQPLHKEVSALQSIDSQYMNINQQNGRLESFTRNTFPRKGWTPGDYGPVIVPKKEEPVPLTAETWNNYQAILEDYEQQAVTQTTESTFEIDGEEVQQYVVKQDYFFVVGDNRNVSIDSRFWGYVPQDHIIGKAVAVLFSWDDQSKAPDLKRIFKRIL